MGHQPLRTSEQHFRRQQWLLQLLVAVTQLMQHDVKNTCWQTYLQGTTRARHAQVTCSARHSKPTPCSGWRQMVHIWSLAGNRLNLSRCCTFVDLSAPSTLCSARQIPVKSAVSSNGFCGPVHVRVLLASVERCEAVKLRSRSLTKDGGSTMRSASIPGPGTYDPAGTSTPRLSDTAIMIRALLQTIPGLSRHQ
jgi:hypothetical protein